MVAMPNEDEILELTPEQEDYFNNEKPGGIDADILKRIFKGSVQDQKKMLKEADKIRKRHV